MNRPSTTRTFSGTSGQGFDETTTKVSSAGTKPGVILVPIQILGASKQGGEKGSHGEGFDETGTTIRTSAANSGGGDKIDGDRRTSEGGFDETKTVTTTGANGKEGERRTSEEGFDETRTKTTMMKMLGNQEESLGGMNEEGFDEMGHRITSTTFGATSKSSTNARPSCKVAFGRASGQSEEGFDEISYEDLEGGSHRLASTEYEGTDFGIATETKTAETEQLCSAESEEKKTFTISSVINPIDKTEISLQQAIMLGIIRPTEGCYVNSLTAETLPIARAMSEGLIKVMFTKTKRTPEKVSSIGIITVKTIRETARPYTILSVKDTRTGEELDQREASKRGILNERQGTYTDPKTGKKMLIVEASEKGLVKIEMSGSQASEPEVITKTYAVRAVVDRRLKKTVTFHEAVKRGLIDKESGAFRDTVTGEKMYVGDAIMRGFLKARLIDDPTGLNIDPENKLVIDKTAAIRDKLLNPLKVISAFKMAAKNGTNKTENTD